MKVKNRETKGGKVFFIVCNAVELFVQVSDQNIDTANQYYYKLELPLPYGMQSYLPPPQIWNLCQRGHQMMKQCLNYKVHDLDVPTANQPMFLDLVEFHLQFLKENKIQYTISA
jgi:hypothetical protein